MNCEERPQKQLSVIGGMPWTSIHCRQADLDGGLVRRELKRTLFNDFLRHRCTLKFEMSCPHVCDLMRPVYPFIKSRVYLRKQRPPMECFVMLLAQEYVWIKDCCRYGASSSHFQTRSGREIIKKKSWATRISSAECPGVVMTCCCKTIQELGSR